MEELKWPVTKCEACDYDLREATPKENEKSNDSSGRLKWTDFCPKCGKGMFVGNRVLPKPTAEVLAEREAQAILKAKAQEVADPEHIITPPEPVGEPSGVPPDKRGAALAEENPDPEALLTQEPSASVQEKPEPGEVKPPGKGQYFCTKCASNHNEKSKLGVRHNKYREA